MTTPYEIPLSPEPQRFTIQLSGTFYQLTVRWNIPASAWVLDIANEDGDPMIAGIPLVTGVNLLEQYAYVGIPGELRVQTDTDKNAVPTYANLGTLGHLFYVLP